MTARDVHCFTLATNRLAASRATSASEHQTSLNLLTIIYVLLEFLLLTDLQAVAAVGWREEPLLVNSLLVAC